MSQVTDTHLAREISDSLNEAKFSGFHLRAIITAGMGFFTSAYDLTVIGTATVLISGIWHVTPFQLGLVNSVSLFATFLGAFFFGRLADVVGRKRIYGVEAGLMAIGAIMSALSQNIVWLIAARTIMGFGIGGDYPLSAVIMSEYANTKDRGKMVGMVFSCQALGFLVGPVIAILLLGAGVSHDLAWRILLGLGAVPAAAVILLRRTLPESPRWNAKVKGDAATAAKELASYSNGVAMARASDRRVNEKLFFKYFVTLIGTAGAWALLDYAFYGNTVSMPLIMKTIAPHAGLLANLSWGAIIFACFAVPGYVCAFMFSDKIGRRALQIIGFAVMAVCFALIGLIPGLTSDILPFLVLFGISFFFIEFGPNVTTFILAAELFPVNRRTTGHGISAGVGKIGAFIGVFLFPVLVSHLHLAGTLLLSAGISVAGLVLTYLCVPEPAGKSLEEVSLEDSSPSHGAGRPALAA